MAGISTRGRAVRLVSALIVAAGASVGVASIAAANEASSQQGAGSVAATATPNPSQDKSGHGKKDGEDRTGKPETGKDAKQAAEQRRAGTGPVPGDNGTVKIHEAGTSAEDRRNEPHVCKFYLDAFGFDAGQAVIWTIHQHAPTGRALATAGTITLDANGHGRTSTMGLPDGHYKLTWTFAGEHGKAKHKVFWVKCKKSGDKPDCKSDKSKDKPDCKSDDKPDCKPTDKPTDKPTSKPTDKPTSKLTDKPKDTDDDKSKDKGKPDCGKDDDSSGDKDSSEVKDAGLASDAKTPSTEVDGLALTGATALGALGAGLALVVGGVALLLGTGRLKGMFRRS